MKSPTPSRKSRPAKWSFAWTRQGIIHSPIGKISFDAAKLAENAHALIGAVLKAKPAAAKGKYVKKVTLTSTMGPGITIDLAEVEAAIGQRRSRRRAGEFGDRK